MASKKRTASWEDLRSVAEELTSERLAVLSELESNPEKLAAAESPPAEVEALPTEMAACADDRLRMPRSTLRRLGSMAADAVPSAPDALGRDESGTAGAGPCAASIGRERMARPGDEAVRDRITDAQHDPFQLAYACPRASVALGLLVALAAASVAGALIVRARLSHRSS